MMEDTLFKNVIGQRQAQAQLKFYIESHNNTGFFPHTILTSAKGLGKSFLAKEVAKSLYVRDSEGKIEIHPNTKKPKRKTFIDLNGTSIKSLTSFVNSVLLPHVVDQNVFVVIDECHSLGTEVQTAMLSMFPSGELESSYLFNGFTVRLNFLKQSFLFCTSEQEKMLDTLNDRLEKISLVEYNTEEIGQIIEGRCSEIKFEKGVVEDIASVARSNARSAAKLGANIIAWIRGNKLMTMKDWVALKEVLGIYKLGLTAVELSILKYLSMSPEISLTGLASRSGISQSCLRLDIEPYLLKKGLIQVLLRGRAITPFGIKYLKELDETS